VTNHSDVTLLDNAIIILSKNAATFTLTTNIIKIDTGQKIAC